MNKFEQYAKHLAHLCRAAILDEIPYKTPKDIDQDLFFEFCLKHRLENIAYKAIAKRDAAEYKESAHFNFEEKEMQAINLDAVQTLYIERILDEFEKHKINHILLKGQSIARLYPTTDFRHSSDCDIYVGKRNIIKTRKIMRELGFEVDQLGGHHDTYRVDKDIHIEIHRDFVHKNYEWDKHCEKILKRLIKVPGYEYRYEMSIEDSYLYMLCHMAKHIKFKGIGMRSVLDMWVCRDLMDWEILNSRIEAAGLREFNINILKLCDYWFENKEADKTTKNLAVFIAACGNHGLSEFEDYYRYNKVEKPYKILKRCVKAVFLPLYKMRRKYTVLDKFPFVLPFCWMHRLIYTLVNKHEVIVEVVDSKHNLHGNINIENARRIAELKEEIGL